MSLDLISDLCVSQGHPVVSSLKVAARFGKQHKDVLRAIGNVSKDLEAEYRQRNFAPTVYERENPSGGAPIQSPAYNLTRDGFSLLVMGFTGKEALAWKVRFLEAFNAMEKALLEGYTRKAPETAVISTKTDREPLYNLAKVWARMGRMQYSDAFTMIAARYSLTSYTLLPTSWLQDAIDWVQSQIDEIQAQRLAPAVPAAEVSEKMLAEAKAEGVMTMALAMDKASQLRSKDTTPVTVRLMPDALLAMSALIVKVASLLAGHNAATEDITGAVARIIQNGLTGTMVPAS